MQILPVELRVAEREGRARRIGLQLSAAAKALAGERPVDTDEVLRRRDVVVDERHAVGQRKRGARSARPEREMMQQQIVGMAEVDELAVVARQRLQAVVRGLDENIRMVARRAQHALNAENLVADRIAITQTRAHLMYAHHYRAHPAGSLAPTSSPARSSPRPR